MRNIIRRTTFCISSVGGMGSNQGFVVSVQWKLKCLFILYGIIKTIDKLMNLLGNNHHPRIVLCGKMSNFVYSRAMSTVLITESFWMIQFLFVVMSNFLNN